MISDERLKQLEVEGDLYNYPPTQEELNSMAKELLALRSAREGWKLVPVEPTAEMLDSQEHEMLPMVHHDSMRERSRMIRRHGWRVMLAAAPEPD